jgi:hypothetical protein
MIFKRFKQIFVVYNHILFVICIHAVLRQIAWNKPMVLHILINVGRLLMVRQNQLKAYLPL